MHYNSIRSSLVARGERWRAACISKVRLVCSRLLRLCARSFGIASEQRTCVAKDGRSASWITPYKLLQMAGSLCVAILLVFYLLLRLAWLVLRVHASRVILRL